MNQADAGAGPSSAAGFDAARWTVRTLGGLELDDGLQVITRLPSRPVATLLARLALAPQRAHPREELIELLWPGIALDIGRNRLRQVLSTLRALLEPPGGGPVLIADRGSVRVVPGALACDALAFEAACRRRDHAAARHLYRGELLPGFYDEWVSVERTRLSALAERTREHDDESKAGAPARVEAPAAASAPPATSAAAKALPPLRLPRYLTRLFGIEAAVRDVVARVRSERLVSIVGPGGAGKSRLGVEVTRELSPHFLRVLHAPLVACSDAAQLRSAVAVALGLPAADPAALDDALAAVPTLLVLDNFEQLVGTAEGQVAAWLATSEQLHVLATTRRPLGLDGEQLFELGPLLPPEGPADLRHPALEMFADRARAVRADFRLGPRNVDTVVALVRALGGLPLAIELAASRVRSLPIVEMLAALSQPQPAALDLLQRSGPRSGVDPRHATMRHTIAWSWRLLTPEQSRLLAWLTLLPATFSAAAAAALHGGSAVTQLDDLVAHSLLRPEGTVEGMARYALSEPVREFAAEHLAGTAAAADLAAARARLRRWLLDWARALPRQARPIQVQAELATLRSLMRPALADGAAAETLAAVLALRPWWDADGMAPADIADLEAALIALEGEAADRSSRALCADVHELLAHLRFGSGAGELALAHAEAALRWAGDDPAPRARALVRRAWVDLAGQRFDTDAPAALTEALALAEASGDLETQARALHQLALLAQNRPGCLDEAEALLTRSMALWQQLGDRPKAMARLRGLADLMQLRGRIDEALAVYAESEAAAAADGDWVGLLDAALLQGLALARQRRWADAAAAVARSAAVSAQRHHGHGLAYALWSQPLMLARLRRPEAAARLMGFAERFWQARVGRAPPADRHHLRRVRRLVTAQLGRARAAALCAEGAALTLPRAIDIALLRDACGHGLAAERVAPPPCMGG